MSKIGWFIATWAAIGALAVTILLVVPAVNQLEQDINIASDSLKSATRELREFKAHSVSQDSIMWNHITLAAYQLPESLYVCGQRVPLDRPLVWEKVEQELYRFLRLRHLLVMWWKLSGRYFPMIERSLKELGLPDDLKYMAILEGLLNPQAVSRAKAVGIWQFMPTTGRLYGLKQDGVKDDRRDPWRSTRASGEYLLDLEELTRLRLGYTDYFLVLAAYNAGLGRINEAIIRQKNRDYWTLKLSRDTERYGAQFVALVVLFSQPEMLGLTDIPRYAPLPEIKDTVVSLPQGGTYKYLADAANLSLDDFMLINVAYQADRLPPGKYVVRHIRPPETN